MQLSLTYKRCACEKCDSTKDGLTPNAKSINDKSYQPIMGQPVRHRTFSRARQSRPRARHSYGNQQHRLDHTYAAAEVTSDPVEAPAATMTNGFQLQQHQPRLQQQQQLQQEQLQKEQLQLQQLLQQQPADRLFKVNGSLALNATRSPKVNGNLGLADTRSPKVNNSIGLSGISSPKVNSNLGLSGISSPKVNSNLGLSSTQSPKVNGNPGLNGISSPKVNGNLGLSGTRSPKAVKPQRRQRSRGKVTPEDDEDKENQPPQTVTHGKLKHYKNYRSVNNNKILGITTAPITTSKTSPTTAINTSKAVKLLNEERKRWIAATTLLEFSRVPVVFYN